jgi:Carboxypeptidase regulatory-like domain
MRRGLRSVSVLLMFSIAALCSSAARAQELYGSIRGTVTDQSGAAVPDVTLTATNEATNVAHTVTSTADGTYSFLQLAIGDYTVRAEKTGFQPFSATKIHLDVNTVYQLPIRITLGAVTQEVTVQANPVQVESTTPQLGTVIDANQIVNMPLIGRNFVNLQALQPGVMSGSDRFSVNYNFATNGAQSQMNLYLIDGTETNDIALNTPGFIPSPDALQEFRLVTSTLNPEYSRSSGAILNTVFKSGTNSFHGDAFDFYRDTFLNARNYFAPTREIYHQNLFGGTLGGPVIKNHTFFFVSYQGERAVRPQTNPIGPTIVTNVFSTAQRAGNFGAGAFAGSTKSSPFSLFGDPCPAGGAPCPAGTPYSTLFASGNIPTQDFNSISAALLNKYVPSPNFGTSQFSFNASEPITDDQLILRIDQTFNNKDSMWGTWVIESFPTTDTIPFAGATLPGFGSTNKQHWKFVTVSWTHIINDHMLNELRLGYNRFNYAAVFPQNPMLPSAAGFSITPQHPADAAMPVMQVNGLFTLGFSQFGPQPRIDQNYDGADNFSATEGRHTMKLGVEVRKWLVWNPFETYNSGFYTFSQTGTYSTGNTGADFLLGIPAFYAQSSGGLQHNRAYEVYSYAQDEYKLRPNFTLMYGLGWTIDTPMTNFDFNNHAQVAFRPGQQSVIFPNAPLGVVYQGDPGVNAAGENKIFKYFGPRLGFAYSPDWGWISGGPGRLSIRGGFGIYYNRSEQEQDLQVLGMAPFSITSLLGASSGGVLQINPSFAKPFVDISTGAAITNPYPFAGAPSNVQFTAANGYLPIFSSCCAVLDANTQDPMAENYNLTVQRQLSDSMILSLGYVGSVAHHLTYGLPQNVADASGTFRYPTDIYGSVDTLYSGANSNYNSFQASLNKRLANGLQFLASYTYSHSFDQASGFENSTFGGVGGGNLGYGGFGGIRSTNPYCFPGCDYASSIFDARQRLVVSYFYEIPGLHSSSWMLSRLTSGWTIAGITTFQTGFPLDVIDSSFPSGGYQAAASDFTSWEGPDLIGPIHYFDPRNSPDNAWFSASSFAQVSCAPSCTNPAAASSYGNAPRNLLRGPGLNNWDFQLYKDTQINERMKVETRIEFYNVFNHTQFDPIGVITDINNPAFGTETAAHDPRLIQLAAKVYF